VSGVQCSKVDGEACTTLATQRCTQVAKNWTAIHCTALHCTALHCTALHCTALQEPEVVTEEVCLDVEEEKCINFEVEAPRPPGPRLQRKASSLPDYDQD
jgi:hypothetical protein